MIRKPVTDPTARIGTLVAYPGGPGGSGVDFVRGGVPLAAPVQEAFDIVGWDPRGVGATAPECGQSLPAFYAADSAPQSDAAQEHLEALASTVAEECAVSSGDELTTISTTATINDLEMLRQALDEPLNYAGFSYGTQIGLLYAEAYGEQLRAMALIGVVDPALDFEGFLADQAAAVDGAADQMLGSCEQTESCDLADPVAAYDQLARRVRQGEFEAAGLGPAQLIDATLGALYNEAAWPTYLEALEAADAGDPGQMVAATGAYYGNESLFLPYTAISCLQETPPPGPEYRDFAAELGEVSPRFGADIANELLPCAYWSAAAVDEAAEVTASTAPTILLVASAGDAITPLEWTEAVSARLADSALIVRDGEGHIGTSRSACVAEGIALYLLEPEGTTDRLECES